MTLVLSVVAPIFILIALGTLSAKSGYLPSSTGDALSGFVFKVAVPALMFRTVATADFGGANPLLLWIAYFAGVAPVYAAGMWIGRRLAGTDQRGAVIAGVSASFSNLIFVGVPMTERAFGREGLDVLALLLAIHLPTMMLVSTLLLERAALGDARDGGEAASFSPRRVVGQVARNLSRNALVVGLALGALWRWTGLPLNGPHGEVVRLVAGTAGPTALFALGMSMVRFSVGSDRSVPLVLTALSLLVQPLIVYAIGVALLPPLWLAVAVAGAACPVGVNAYLFATFFRTGERLAASVIVLSTLLSALTLTGWLALMP
ncbi:AEC family transporter [uncultured Aureimonas sp.]|uniref:AEC family transporter n=1 Tax=uncultured Aureimonas sp. TaxID=1604662 RepID=UPI0025EFECB5|nr:AEC family transporter [uncultured Aureimonas sp.]